MVITKVKKLVSLPIEQINTINTIKGDMTFSKFTEIALDGFIQDLECSKFDAHNEKDFGSVRMVKSLMDNGYDCVDVREVEVKLLEMKQYIESKYGYQNLGKNQFVKKLKNDFLKLMKSKKDKTVYNYQYRTNPTEVRMINGFIKNYDTLIEHYTKYDTLYDGYGNDEHNKMKKDIEIYLVNLKQLEILQLLKNSWDLKIEKIQNKRNVAMEV